MRILLVEKAPGTAHELGLLLDGVSGDAVAVERAPRVSVAMERLLVDAFDGVILAVGEAGELDLAIVERVLLAALHVPVLVVAAHAGDAFALQALRLGAQEVLEQDGLTAAEVVRRVRHAAERQRRVGALSHQALHDPLTGLPNRVLLHDRLRQALSRLGRTETCLALMFADLDGFKAVNDREGHAAGDAVLVQVGRALRHTLRGGDTAARMGGDEFVVLCEDVAGEPQARRLAARVLRRLPVPASMGVALAGSSSVDPAALMREADAAMYRVKRAGGSAFAFAIEGERAPV